MMETIIEAVGAALADLISLLKRGENLPPLGLRRSSRLPVLAALYRLIDRPVLLVTDRYDRALVLLDELGFWLPDSNRLLYPEPNPLFYEDAPWGITTRRDRLAVLSVLAAYLIPGEPEPKGPPIIVATARALMTRTLPRRDFLKSTRSLRSGQVVSPEELLRSWVSLGYELENIVITPGQAARRGGILDIWPPSSLNPVRIDFFGDEIDSLRLFDPTSQRTVGTVDRLLVTPAREYLVSEPLPSLVGQLHSRQGEVSDFHEFLIPVFHPMPAGMLDYLPRQALILLDDLVTLREVVNEIDEQSGQMRQDYISDGLLPVDFPTPYLSWSELEDSWTGRQMIDLGIGDVTPEAKTLAVNTLSDQFEPGPRFGGRLRPAIEHITQALGNSESVHIVSRQKDRLNELWAEHTAGHLELPSSPVIVEGSLTEGWVFKTPANEILHLLTDGELFGWRRPEPRQRHRPVAEAPEAAYADLEPGDWVVHVDHGIGRYINLVQRTVDGLEREYLCVEYAEGDQLFVPVYQADRLTRYLGPDSRMPTPTRLGSAEWRTTKSQVKEAVEYVAEDLLNLYAQRQIVVGHSFGADSTWQQELEASFPYIETEDQLRVITEVKRDMENLRPMDRLICGDVGYGKTEVALRASFKAVLDGKQVALLVPTTVLAQQHFNTFRERLSAFPVEVEMLSRFRLPVQQKEILRRLAEGSIDIVIGTHRLIQSDVEFKNLGLLVVDEEQRFGVMHKERLKQMRTEVDVLTMTATPIPRTLYMALTGVRDISTINTPPEERLPVITHVGPYSQRLVRQAVMREMERGGQVFFVHNRVQTIQAMRSHLEKIIPEARISVAHGQMAEQQLSERMAAFTNGEVDILLSTSIIESGLDIPNANTLIVDRADTFGLAQLYQLRGRVGRGAQRAYAYFFRHNRIPPTIEGRQRLETISENTQLGSGFNIAMRDLEIRGTGDILGTRQHGNIAAVGFHLYTRLLADAVRQIRLSRGVAGQDMPGLAQVAPGMREIRNPVTIELPLEVGIPSFYVPDRNSRLRLYRRIADSVSLNEIDSIKEEFKDRFGPLPEAVINLLYQLKIRILAERAGLVTVSAESGQIVMRYPSQPESKTHVENREPRHIPDVSPLARVGKNAVWMLLDSERQWMDTLQTVLMILSGTYSETSLPH
jgi:transcription-repair coupling factor (superfamily II helicase)